MDNDVVMYHITEAVEGLVYISGSESPLTPFIWPGAELPDGVGVQSLRVYLRLPEGVPITIIDTDTFFDGMFNTGNPHAMPFQEKMANLYRLLNQSLADLTVFQIGEDSADVYVVGKTDAGDYAGVSTRVGKKA